MDSLHTVRPLTSEDEELLLKAVVDNVNWESVRFSVEDVRSSPELHKYARLVPGRGDFGFRAGSEGRDAGVVWLQFLPADMAGYGFVADGVPELSVSVFEPFRGQGIGRDLLSTAIAAAASRGIKAVSLSVEDGNPARKLYESLGFTPVDRARDGTLMLQLGPTGWAVTG